MAVGWAIWPGLAGGHWMLLTGKGSPCESQRAHSLVCIAVHLGSDPYTQWHNILWIYSSVGSIRAQGGASVFEEHNRLTKATYWLLAINSLVGFAIITVFAPQFLRGQPWPVYILTAASGLMLVFNTYLAYLVYTRSLKALQLCLWLYGLQVAGFQAENLTFNLTFTLSPTMRLGTSGSTEIIFNLLSFAFFLFILSAYRSVRIRTNGAWTHR